MKSLAFKKHYFTAELWTYELVFGTGGTESRNYKYARDVKFTMGTDGMLSRVTVYADEQFPLQTWLVDIRDRQGNEVYLIDPRDLLEGLRPIRGLFVNDVEPVISLTGYREGFRHRCQGLDTGASSA